MWPVPSSRTRLVMNRRSLVCEGTRELGSKLSLGHTAPGQWDCPARVAVTAISLLSPIRGQFAAIHRAFHQRGSGMRKSTVPPSAGRYTSVFADVRFRMRGDTFNPQDL